jgi:hypothetical protein
MIEDFLYRFALSFQYKSIAFLFEPEAKILNWLWYKSFKT